MPDESSNLQHHRCLNTQTVKTDENILALRVYISATPLFSWAKFH